MVTRITDAKVLYWRGSGKGKTTDVKEWASQLSGDWLKVDDRLEGVLYIDGHVNLYYGHQVDMPKRYVSSMRLCMSGSTDYRVNNQLGQPFFVFAVHTEDPEDKTNAITRHLINLYSTMSGKAFFKMLDTWYAMLEKTIEALQAAFPVASEQELKHPPTPLKGGIKDSKAEMDALYQFNQQQNISYTPAILLNGRLLSQTYSYKDLYGIARALNA